VRGAWCLMFAEQGATRLVHWRKALSDPLYLIHSMSLSHPNLLPTFKTCVVRLLPEPASSWPSTELTVTSSNAASELGSTGSGSVLIHPNSPTRVVRSILDRNALVEVMPLTSVLQPG